ncbi:MAG: glycoside hydrolase family 2 [Eubacterium sp.]|nr:glycoside hydrolase family 2 [Eubacterium sp.]
MFKRLVREAADLVWIPRLAISQGYDALLNLMDKRENKKKILSQTSLKEERLYPRPQLERDYFFSLDGIWKFAPKSGSKYPVIFSKKIKVPYPPESEASLFEGECGTSFWYEKRFTVPANFEGKNVILHFGAVDQVCKVYINKKFAGKHEGGYLPFSFDITKYLTDGENEIAVYVKDDLNIKYPYGKQTKHPEGMWYTPVSGIWQSVWLEAVGEKYVKNFICRYDGENVEFDIDGTADEYEIKIFDAQINHKESEVIKNITLPKGKSRVYIDDIKLWTPEKPYLYDVVISTPDDKVKSYFALRTVSIEDIGGKERICINNKPYFFHGVLDQGYFCDGIYTPVSDRCFEQDIRYMKKLGFNTIRKHIKVEPARFYYDCDRLGMFVFQDMVNNGEYSYFLNTLLPTFWGQSISDRYTKVKSEIKETFEKHSIATIKYLENFQSIVYYTVFNEGWGQYDSERIVTDLKEVDSSRVYDGASGWYKQLGTDVDSDHFYFHMIKPKRWTRPVIISECGGFTMVIPGHSMFMHKIYGYGHLKGKNSLTERIYNMYNYEVIPNIKKGICGCIYTQLSDVEGEANGLYTYDRAVCKVNKEKMVQLARKIYKEFKKVTDKG